MVTIVEASEEQRDIWCSRNELPVDCRALIAVCGDEPVGYILYRLEQKTVQLLFMQAEDPVLREALVRAAMNAGQNAGAAEAVGTPGLCALWQRLRFTRRDEDWHVDLDEFFSRSCCGRA